MTNNNQLKGAAEKRTAAATVTVSGNDYKSGNDGSSNDGGGDDGSCGDGDGNTDGGSGSVDGDSDGGNCNNDGIVVVMVKAMVAAMPATMAVAAMAGGHRQQSTKRGLEETMVAATAMATETATVMETATMTAIIKTPMPTLMILA